MLHFVANAVLKFWQAADTFGACMQADAATQREDAASVPERKMEENLQRRREVLVVAGNKQQLAEDKHQQQLADQHDASLQSVQDAICSDGQQKHQQQLEALQAQLDSQVLAPTLVHCRQCTPLLLFLKGLWGSSCCVFSICTTQR